MKNQKNNLEPDTPLAVRSRAKMAVDVKLLRANGHIAEAKQLEALRKTSDSNKLPPMKKLFLHLLLLMAMMSVAQATDIAVTGTTIAAAQFKNLGNNVSLPAVSVTNSATAVTCTSCIPSQYVGLGGFLVSLAGTDYEVQFVTSTSALALKNVYIGSTATVAATIYPLVELRIYSDRAYWPRGAAAPILEGSENSGFFWRYGCTAVNNTIRIPDLTIPATTDAVNVSERFAKLTAVFFRLNGGRLDTYNFCGSNSSFGLQATPTTQTWGDICTYTTPTARVLPDYSTLTADQIRAQIATRGNISGTYRRLGRISATGGNIENSSLYEDSGGNLLAENSLAVGGAVTSTGTITTSSDVVGATPTKTIADLSGSYPCNAANVRRRVEISDSDRIPRKCKNTTGSTYTWVPERAYVLIDDFGADVAGVADSTASVQAAVDTGREVRAGIGTYLIDTVYIPNGRGFKLIGSGYGATIFKARTANTTLFKKVASAGVQGGAWIGQFSIQAHASGSTVTALSTSGFRDSVFYQIEGLSTSSHGFTSLIELSAYPYLCYKVTLDNIRLETQTGWATMIDFQNGGQGANWNANIINILNPWIVGNTDLATGIDALRSAKVRIVGGLIEGNTVATGIKCGTSTTIQDNWFELNGTDIDYPLIAGEGAGNGGYVIGNYFSTAHDVDFHGTQYGNVWIGNVEAGAQTFVNSPGVSNVKRTFAETYNPTAPSFAYDSGQAGSLSGSSVVVVGNYSQWTGQVIYKYSFSWTPAAATANTRIALTIPSGYTVVNFTANAIRGASGEPIKCAAYTDSLIWINNPYTDNSVVTGFITLAKNGVN